MKTKNSPEVLVIAFEKCVFYLDPEPDPESGLKKKPGSGSVQKRIRIRNPDWDSPSQKAKHTLDNTKLDLCAYSLGGSLWAVLERLELLVDAASPS